MVKAAISVPDNGPAKGARKRTRHTISDNSQTSSGRNRKRPRTTRTQEQKNLEKEHKVMAEKARDERLEEAYETASEDWRKHLKWHCVDAEYRWNRVLDKSRKKASQVTGLTSIPAGIFSMITDRCDPKSILMLTLTCKSLHAILTCNSSRSILNPKGLASVPCEIFIMIIDGCGTNSILMLSLTCKSLNAILKPFLDLGAPIARAIRAPRIYEPLPSPAIPAPRQRLPWHVDTSDLIKVLDEQWKSDGHWKNYIIPEMAGRLLCRTAWGFSGDLMRPLLDSGANPNKADDNGYTPLHHAVRYKDMVRIQWLLGTGAIDINVRTDIAGWTPLMVAVYGMNEDAVRILCVSGAEVNKRDNTGSTALHIAYRHHMDNVVKSVRRVLIEYGANVDKRDSLGFRPSDYHFRKNKKRYNELYGTDMENFYRRTPRSCYDL